MPPSDPDRAADGTADGAAEGAAGARHHRRLLGVLAIFLLVLGLPAAWVWQSAQQRGQVVVSWAGPVTCDGARAATTRVAPPPTRPAPTLRLRSGMDCTLRVRVANRGWRPVTVDQVRLPGMGPRGGAAVQVTELAGAPALTTGADTIDAVFEVARPVAPGDGFDLEVDFVFRPEGCTEALTHTTGMPTVTVSALGLPGDRGAGRTIAFAPTRESRCPA